MQSLEEENRVGARAPRGRRFGRRACMHAAPPAAFAVRCAATGHAAPHLLSVGRCSQLMAGQLKHFRNVLALSKGASDAYAAVAMRLGLAPGGTGAPAGVTAAPRAEAGGAVSPTPKGIVGLGCCGQYRNVASCWLVVDELLRRYAADGKHGTYGNLQRNFAGWVAGKHERGIKYHLCARKMARRKNHLTGRRSFF